jgi:hypothetical protein
MTGDDVLRYLVGIKVHASFSVTVQRLPIGGWCETDDEPEPHERLPPGVYLFVERADGQLVGGLYGPRVFWSLDDVPDDECFRVERSRRKLAMTECHRMFASVAAAKAWAIWDARARSKGHAAWFVDKRPPAPGLPAASDDGEPPF